ncbi:Phosphatidate phosphatase LPIN1 [Varanus komodoensis]|nr:Phosphatidate phosphatase LPIN1 [Varanus komodoensis]
MNYVGQLAGQVFVTVKELYKGLNPATLSGCIDVIVVRQPDGTLQCSPFHVRFGKMGVLRSKEKVVDIEINGESVDLHMKLGDNGEAFFVEETEGDQEAIPYHLATSPIISEGSALMELQLKRNSADRIRNLDGATPSQLSNTAPSVAESNSASSSVKKRRKRRRRSTHKIDTSKRDENADTTEDENMFPIEISSSEENELLDNARTSVAELCRDSMPEINPTSVVLSHPYSDGEWSPLQSPSGSRPSTPKSDSELVNKSLERGVQKNNPQMHWDWGELPQATKTAGSVKPKEPSTTVVNVSPSKNTHFRVIQSHDSEEFPNISSSPALGLNDVVISLEETGIQEAEPVINEPDIDTLGAAAAPVPANEEAKLAMTSLTQQANKTDSPSKKKVVGDSDDFHLEAIVILAAVVIDLSNSDIFFEKISGDKRSRHLGADGVYLDDLTDMEPEVAALYFPKNGEHAAPSKNTSEVRTANRSPQSLGSSGVDSGIESTSDGIRDLPSIAISLCGGLNENKEISKEKFLEQEVTYQQFVDNPAIIDDPNLVVKIGSKYYNWTTAAPLLLAMQAFQKPLPKATVDSIMRDKMPKKGGRWWFSWRGRTTSSKEETKPVQGLNGKEETDTVDRIKDESSSSDEDPRASNQAFGSLPTNTNHLPLLSGIGYKKSLRLSSEQLKGLNLKNGPNDVIFSVTTQYQGTCRCEGTIYLWNWDDKVIISDIDGTITRSDTLGHILPTLGKDWTHQGIAKLYHKVSQEVIEKKPEKFKVQCLTDIKNLFHPNTEPFYAAFGNRPADVYSYKQVGVSLNRIFTVNPKGELIQEHAKTNISSYVRLCEVVDHVFPLLKRRHSSDFPCSDTYSQFTFWREPLPPFENQDIQPDVP